MTVQWMDAESIDLTLIGCPSSNDQSQDPSGESGVEDIPNLNPDWADEVFPIAKRLTNEIPRTHWMTS